MKVAAMLALIVAVVSGAWAINDCRTQEAVKRDFVGNEIVYFTMRTDSGDTTRLDLREITAYHERRDARGGGTFHCFSCRFGCSAFTKKAAGLVKVFITYATAPAL